MTLREFHNGLRILLNLDSDVLVKADVLDGVNGDFIKFSADPFRFMIRANDDTADKLWALMQTRMPKVRPVIVPITPAEIEGGYDAPPHA